MPRGFDNLFQAIFRDGDFTCNEMRNTTASLGWVWNCCEWQLIYTGWKRK